MSIQIERKGYGYAKTLLEKIHAYATDLGWMASVQLFEHSKPKEKRVTPYGTDSMSAADQIKWLLDGAEKNKPLQNWFAEMDRRAVEELVRNYGGRFENMLRSLHETIYNQNEEVLQRSLHISLEVTSLCNVLRHRLDEETQLVKNPIQELADFCP